MVLDEISLKQENIYWALRKRRHRLDGRADNVRTRVRKALSSNPGPAKSPTGCKRFTTASKSMQVAVLHYRYSRRSAKLDSTYK